MPPALTSKAKIGRRFYAEVDEGRFPRELFAQDFQFFFPKFGRGRGDADFMTMAAGARSTKVSGRHHLDDFVFIECGRLLAIEGTSEGVGPDGATWHGGRTSGGRFCTVFEFNDDGLICRMHVYLDPDFAGADTARFRWPGRAEHDW